MKYNKNLFFSQSQTDTGVKVITAVITVAGIVLKALESGKLTK